MGSVLRKLPISNGYTIYAYVLACTVCRETALTGKLLNFFWMYVHTSFYYFLQVDLYAPSII